MNASRGFTVVEVLITLAIMGIVIGTVFSDYAGFADKSLQRVRVAELGEFIRYAQDLSSAGEIFSSDPNDPSTDGFQAIRIKVRKGQLETFQVENVSGSFTTFDNTKFDPHPDADLLGTDFITLGLSEDYFVDACFIDIDGTSKYTRETLLPDSNGICIPQTSMLCESPDPTGIGYDAGRVTSNNFDIHFSIEQPSREVHANIFPVQIANDGTETYVYSEAVPNGPQSRISNTYEGIRVLLFTRSGTSRGLDVYNTGLISYTKADASCDIPPDINATCDETVLSGSCKVASTIVGGHSGTCITGYTGTCKYTCGSNGRWTLFGDGDHNSCLPICAGSVPLNWSEGDPDVTCTAVTTPGISGGQSVLLEDTEGNTQGRATFSCNADGSWNTTPENPECSVHEDPVCPGRTFIWSEGSQSCESDAAVPDTPGGNAAPTVDSTGSEQGQATFSCNTDGSWNTTPKNPECRIHDVTIFRRPIRRFGAANITDSADSNLARSIGGYGAFGSSIAVEGNLMVAGALDTLTGNGGIYIFRDTDNDGVFSAAESVTSIRFTDLGSRGGVLNYNTNLRNQSFGAAVSINNGRIAVGAPGYDNDSGAIWILEDKNGDNDYTDVNDGEVTQISKNSNLDSGIPHIHIANITPPRFGSAVILEGSRLIVGAEMVRATGGAVFILGDSDGNGIYGESGEHTVIDDGSPGSRGVHFGYAVATDGSRLIVGAPHDNIGGRDRGAVHILNDINGDNRYDGQNERIIINNETVPLRNLALFGSGVAIAGDRIIVGSPQDDAEFRGAIYILEDKNHDNDYKDTDEVLRFGTQPGVFDIGVGDRFGRAVAIDGNNLYVSATGIDASAGYPNVGGLYLFSLSSLITGLTP